MSIQVTFTVEQYEKNAATILAILKGGAVAANDVEEGKSAAKTPAKTPAKAPAKTPAKKAPPKVSIQEAQDALMAVKDADGLGLAECRKVMSEAGVPGTPPKMADVTEEHAEKIVELCKMLLEGGEEGSDDENDDL